MLTGDGNRAASRATGISMQESMRPNTISDDDRVQSLLNISNACTCIRNKRKFPLRRRRFSNNVPKYVNLGNRELRSILFRSSLIFLFDDDDDEPPTFPIDIKRNCLTFVHTRRLRGEKGRNTLGRRSIDFTASDKGRLKVTFVEILIARYQRKIWLFCVSISKALYQHD